MHGAMNPRRQPLRATFFVRLVVAVTPGLLLTGCVDTTAKRTVYESMQGAARQNCYLLPDAREQTECLQQHSLPFEQYSKQREALGRDNTAQP